MAQQATTDGIPAWTLGWRLKRALAEIDIKAEQMADEIGYSRGQVSRWLNDKGTPRPSVLRVWALRCGVPYQWLTTGDTSASDGPDGQPISPSACNNVTPLHGRHGNSVAA